MATPQPLKRAMSLPATQWFLSAIGAGYVLLVRGTSRVDLPPPPTGGPYIIALWHGRLAMLHLLRFGDHDLVALISTHRDGQLISKCAWHYNIQTVFGSKSRGGMAAVRQLIRLANDGHNLFITPDGPRGPSMRVNDGIIEIARLSGLPILPAAIATSGGKTLDTWDRFLVPVPFSRIAVRWGAPFQVSQDDGVADNANKLETALVDLQLAADRAVNRPQ